MYFVDRVKLWAANATVQCMITRRCVCMHVIYVWHHRKILWTAYIYHVLVHHT